jgi:hypothetical protein
MNVRLETQPDGVSLLADCADTANALHPTRFLLSSVVSNANGQLVIGNGAFDKTCSQIALAPAGGPAVLQAVCRRTDNTEAQSRLDLNVHLTNLHGALMLD